MLWRLFDVNGMSKVTDPFRFKLDVPRNEKPAVAAIVSLPLTEKTFFFATLSTFPGQPGLTYAIMASPSGAPNGASLCGPNPKILDWSGKALPRANTQAYFPEC